MTWQPINTAPEWSPADGQLLTALLYSPDFGVQIGRVGNYEGEITTSIAWIATPGGGPNALGITHWMPLPDPPAKERA